MDDGHSVVNVFCRLVLIGILFSAYGDGYGGSRLKQQIPNTGHFWVSYGSKAFKAGQRKTEGNLCMGPFESYEVVLNNNDARYLSVFDLTIWTAIELVEVPRNCPRML